MSTMTSPDVGELLHKKKCGKGGKKKFGRVTRGKRKGCWRKARKTRRK